MNYHYSYAGGVVLCWCDATHPGGRRAQRASTDAVGGGGEMSRRAPPGRPTRFGPDPETGAPLVPDLSDRSETTGRPERVGRNPLEPALMEGAE